eukprot:scaffold44985_cov68-Phaeocystis_antarctica.AAC.12
MRCSAALRVTARSSCVNVIRSNWSKGKAQRIKLKLWMKWQQGVGSHLKASAVTPPPKHRARPLLKARPLSYAVLWVRTWALAGRGRECGRGRGRG